MCRDYDRIPPVPQNSPDNARSFRRAVGRPFQTATDLGEHSTFRIGGPADYFFAARTLSELRESLRFARSRAIPHYVIGSGTNLLFDDEGYRGLIVKNEVGGIERPSRGATVRVLES